MGLGSDVVVKLTVLPLGRRHFRDSSADIVRRNVKASDWVDSSHLKRAMMLFPLMELVRCDVGTYITASRTVASDFGGRCEGPRSLDRSVDCSASSYLIFYLLRLETIHHSYKTRPTGT